MMSKKPISDTLHAWRRFLRSDYWEQAGSAAAELTDQQKGLPFPPPQKPLPEKAILIELPNPKAVELQESSIKKLIDTRRSHRKFNAAALTLEQLSYLCWSAQGVQNILNGGRALFRTVPSAGARHSLETYLVINRVDTLAAGLYRYMGIEHKLLQVQIQPDIARQCVEACCGQSWMENAAVVFGWAAVPCRMEWRYGNAAGKLIALDVGHVCQNLYLAAGSIGAGCCAVAAYLQSRVDTLLQLDGTDEFCVYLAAVGIVE